MDIVLQKEHFHLDVGKSGDSEWFDTGKKQKLGQQWRGNYSEGGDLNIQEKTFVAAAPVVVAGAGLVLAGHQSL